MKPNLLRTPIIKSAVFLGLVCLVVYFTLTLPGGSIWNAVGAVFSLLFGAAQLIIALGLGILTCLAALIGIFLGAVALFDTASASRMYEYLRTHILDWIAPLADLFSSGSSSEERLQDEMSELGTRLKTEFTAMVGSARSELSSAQNELSGMVQALQSKLNGVEETAEGKASAEELEEISTELSNIKEAVAAVESSLKGVQDKVEQALKEAAKPPEIDAAALLGELPARIEKLEQQEIPAPVDLSTIEKGMAALNTEISGLKSSLEEIRKAQEKAAREKAVQETKPASAPAPDAKKEAPKKTEQKTAGQPAKKAEKKAAKQVEKKAGKKAKTKEPELEHRLMSYFDNEADRKKLASLVAETMKKDMTYAQVTDYLIKNMGKQGEVISGHPALAKDYIRQCRRKA